MNADKRGLHPKTKVALNQLMIVLMLVVLAISTYGNWEKRQQLNQLKTEVTERLDSLEEHLDELRLAASITMIEQQRTEADIRHDIDRAMQMNAVRHPRY